MADVKWVKLSIDMFDNRKIKYLRRLPEGDQIVLIWVMLLSMAGKCNANGMIFITENIPYTVELLADELGFKESTVLLALQQLEKLDMIHTKDEFFCISGWEDHQNIEGMDRIREQNRIRKQNQRERERMALSEVSSAREAVRDEEEPEPEAVDDVEAESCHAMSRDSHATDKNKNRIRIDNNIKENNKKKSTTASGDASPTEKRKVFVPPTVDNVREYAQSLGELHLINPGAFIDFYESKGWMVGRTKMKDWKAAVRNWIRRNQEGPKEDTGQRSYGRQNTFNDIMQHSDWDDDFYRDLERIDP